MKTSKRHLAIAIAMAVTLAGPCGHALAQETVWDAGGNRVGFNQANNWTNGIPTSTTIAVFTTNSPTNQPALGAPSNVLGFRFDANAKAYTLSAALGATLTIGTSGIINNSSNIQTFNAPIILNNPQSWSTASTGAIIIGGTVNLAANTLTLNGDGTGASSVGGVITGTTGSITKSGTGIWTLSGANTYSGDTTLSAGTLAAGSNTAFGTGTLNIAGGTLAADGGARTLSNAISVLANFTIGGANNLTLTGTVNFGTPTITVSNTGTTTISGQVVSFDGLTKQGAGRLVLSSDNTTFYNKVTIAQGTLAVQKTGALGDLSYQNSVASGATLEISGGSTVNEGSFDIIGIGVGGVGAIHNLSGSNTYMSTNAQTNLLGDTTISSSAGSLAISGQVNLGAFYLTLGGSGDLSVSGPMFGNGGVTKFGAGTVTLLGGANYYGGVTRINGGILAIDNIFTGASTSGIGASSTDPANLVLNGGTLRYTGAAVSTSRLFSVGTDGGTIDSTGSGQLGFVNTGALGFNGQTGARTLTFTGSSDAYFAPVIGDGGGATSITKNGTGTIILSSVNPYTGTTTINGGTLAITGNKSGAGDVIVSTSGKLAGSGSVAGLTTVSGTISPGGIGGDSGTLTTGAENWQGGGHYLWNINDATGTAGATVGWDLLSISGTLAVNSAVGNTFLIDITGTASNFSGATNSYSWIIATATGGIINFATNKFTPNPNGLTSSHPGTFSISQSGNNLLLNYAAPVPEPESWGAIMGASILLIVLIRRRQTRA